MKTSEIVIKNARKQEIRRTRFLYFFYDIDMYDILLLLLIFI